MSAAGPGEVATAFVKHYYSTFASNRPALSSLYRDTSCLSFEGQQFQGAASIGSKLSSIGSSSIEHHVRSMDVQPAAIPNSIVIGITGTLKIDGGNPLMFTQTFVLVATAPGAFYVHNDIFRFVYFIS